MMSFIARIAPAVAGQAGRLQALRRPCLGVPGDLQGDAGDENLSRFHRRRRQGGRHRRRAARIHGSSRHADARGPGLRAQCAGRHRRARAHPHRRRRQDRHRLRHGARDGARRRLVQFGARLHVLARLHPVAELPHRPLPDRASRRRTRRAAARWSCPTNPSACTIFIARRCTRWPNSPPPPGSITPAIFIPSISGAASTCARRRLSPRSIRASRRANSSPARATRSLRKPGTWRASIRSGCAM